MGSGQERIHPLLIGISFLRDQSSGCTIFVGSGTKICHAFGIKDQKFVYWYKNGISDEKTYLKIPIISPGLIFVQKASLLGLFSGELIFGGAYYWNEFCVSKWVGLDNKNSLL